VVGEEAQAAETAARSVRSSSGTAEGASKAQDAADGAFSGEQARQLVEATFSGALPQALSGVPDQTRGMVQTAAQQGFLHGLNEILLLGAVLSFAGAALALVLVRETEIERETLVGTALEAQPEPARA